MTSKTSIIFIITSTTISTTSTTSTMCSFWIDKICYTSVILRIAIWNFDSAWFWRSTGHDLGITDYVTPAIYTSPNKVSL